MSVTPIDISTRVCAGVDWAKDDHVVCIVDPEGKVVDRFTVPHSAAGLRRLVARRLKAGVDEVGIERPDGPVVDALLAVRLPNGHRRRIAHHRRRHRALGQPDPPRPGHRSPAARG